MHEKEDIKRSIKSANYEAILSKKHLFSKYLNNMPIDFLPFIWTSKVIIFSSYFSPLFLILSPILRILNKKVILYEEIWIYPRTFKHRYLLKIIRLYLKYFVDAYIVTGSMSMRHLTRVMRVDKAKVYQFSNVLQLPWSQNSLIDNNSDQIKVLFAGRLVEYKGIAKALKQFPDDEKYNITVVGSGPQAKLIEEVLSNFKYAKTKYLGSMPRSQLMTIFEENDIFIMPGVFLKHSRIPCESWGFTLQEAISQGCHILATPAVGSAYDIIKRSLPDCIYYPNHALDLKKSLEKLVAGSSRLTEDRYISLMAEVNYSNTKTIRKLQKDLNA